MNGPSPRNIWTAQVGLDRFFFKDKLGWGERDVGGVAVNNNQNTLYENSKDIILIMKI